MRKLLFSLMMSIAVLLTSSLLTSAQFDCPGAPAPRLAVGSSGRVTPGDANNLRAEPNSGATLLGKIPGGDSFVVVGGPVCGDTVVWWQVDYAGLTGWTVEGSGAVYWVEPLTDASAVTAVAPTREPTPAFLPSATPHPHAGLGTIFFFGQYDGDRTYNAGKRGLLRLFKVESDGSDLRLLAALEYGTLAGDPYPWSPGTLSLSPDGTTLLSVLRTEDDTWQLFTIPTEDISAVDPITVLLTSPNILQAPRWSPDGTQIVYSERVETTDDIFINLMIVDADGANPRQITQFRVARISRFVSTIRADWSPDGTRLVFESDHNGNADLYIINTDGSGLAQITQNVAFDHNPRWAADDRIYFFSYRDFESLFRTTTDGGDPIRVSADLIYYDSRMSYALSPDASRMIFAASVNDPRKIGNLHIYIALVDGRQRVQLTQDALDKVFGIAWQPNSP
ncbi:MAG: PD40 domain-containing protein [Armatimonadetes bacterium]|nr:PD40 domain-containing protein [Anaerolineae bacterium]